ncbi:MAG: SDR family NAD(P)-dependent oxidoreductase [Candidatus Omnitrophica bacterium]|nr:SDR family NAD(P)-dependent oxidoreductase [Candidatus Omnitrophota bacterium]
MDLGLNNKIALITGSGRGIGKAVALGLAKEGCKIIVVSRTKSELNQVLKDAGGKSKGHLAIVRDLTKKGSPQKLISLLKSKIGLPDIVVHNLGGALDTRDPFCSMEDFNKIYRLNFEIAVELNLDFLPAMQKNKWGRIIHVSSIAGAENQGPIPYCCAKAALNAYVRSMGGIVGRDNVVLSSILPGAVFTEKGYWDQQRKINPKHVKKFIEERQRIGRFGSPKEIADMIVFLSSELASFNTGSIIPVDGSQGRGYFG